MDLTTKDFIVKPTNVQLKSGQVVWKTPSNIALVKYWGKDEPQLPKNPSISFTLKNCHTITRLVYRQRVDRSDKFSFEVIFEGVDNKTFKPKIQKFFERIVDHVPFIKDYHFTIYTENSFPHSSGIASSASGMSALSMCLMSIEKQLYPKINEAYFYQKASFLARLGSGSASRSIKGELVVWGKHKEIKGSSNLYAVPLLGEIAPIFKDYQDTILLVDKGEKQVSSSVGHDLMHHHDFATSRFQQAHKNCSKLQTILKTGAIHEFIELVESEALTLHAMMMTSKPYFILMKPNTLQIINKVWSYRKSENSNLCFTLDAGANVHLLYPKNEKASVHKFIDQELAIFCQNTHFIHDEVGNGAEKIESD